MQLVAWLFDEAAGFDALLLVLAALVLAILAAALLLPTERAEVAVTETGSST